MQELVELEGLGDEVRRSPLDRIHRVLYRAETRDDDGHDARVAVSRSLDDAGAVDTRQPQVGDDDVERELLEQLQRSLAALGLHDLEAPLRQPLRHQATESGLVIDEEQVRGSGRKIARRQYLDTGKPNDRS